MTIGQIFAAIGGVSGIVGGIVYIGRLLGWAVFKTQAEKDQAIDQANQAEKDQSQNTGRPS